MNLQKGTSHGNGQGGSHCKKCASEGDLEPHAESSGWDLYWYWYKIKLSALFLWPYRTCHGKQWSYLILMALSLTYFNQNNNSWLNCHLKWQHFLQRSSCLRKHRKLCSLYSPNPPSSPCKIALSEPAGPVTRIYDCVRPDQWPGSVLPSNLTHRESGNR